MKYDHSPRDPGLIRESHKPVRNLLRVVGPLVLVVGLVFIAIDSIDFFRAFGTFERPKYFWCLFVGMPLVFFGFAMTGAGFMGAVFRYQASEIAPVGKDTFNYLAEETKPGVHTVVSTAATALREGLTDEPPKPEASAGGEGKLCPACNGPNEPDARFCDQCGAELPTPINCSACDTANDPEAKFCDQCGRSLV